MIVADIINILIYNLEYKRAKPTMENGVSEEEQGLKSAIAWNNLVLGNLISWNSKISAIAKTE